MKKAVRSKTVKISSKIKQRIRKRNIRPKSLPKRKLRSNRSKEKKGDSLVVRILGQGQFKVGSRTANRIRKIDDELIKIIRKHEQAEKDFSRKATQALSIVKKAGTPLEHKEFIQSDIIVPGADMSAKEAKNLFGEQ
jgi:hypothetical protein